MLLLGTSSACHCPPLSQWSLRTHSQTHSCRLPPSHRTALSHAVGPTAAYGGGPHPRSGSPSTTLSKAVSMVSLHSYHSAAQHYGGGGVGNGGGNGGSGTLPPGTLSPPDSDSPQQLSPRGEHDSHAAAQQQYQYQYHHQQQQQHGRTQHQQMQYAGQHHGSAAALAALEHTPPPAQQQLHYAGGRRPPSASGLGQGAANGSYSWPHMHQPASGGLPPMGRGHFASSALHHQHQQHHLGTVTTPTAAHFSGGSGRHSRSASAELLRPGGGSVASMLALASDARVEASY